MILYSLNKYTREMAKRYVTSKSIVIDATCGNGNDTLFLADRVSRGHVYAFDIQAEAIASTKKRCSDFNNIIYINDSHALVDTHVQQEINFAIFNLGFLPNSDSQLATKASNSITAISKMLNLLKEEGAIFITVYTGHDNHAESNEILPFIKNLDKYKYNVLKYEFLNLINPPYLIIIEKKRTK